MVGAWYDHGRGVTADIGEALRWCVRGRWMDWAMGHSYVDSA